MTELADKVIFITGAASGIGAATARLARKNGARIIATDLADEDAIRSGSSAGDDDLVQQLNITDEDGVSACVEAAVKTYGRIDGLVNSAGINGPGSAHAIELDMWRRVLDVHLNGTFTVARRVVQQMLAQKSGAIVNVSSIYGMTGGQGNVAYNTAKGGLLQLTRSMAADYGAAGVRVNAVSPGYIETPMSEMLKDAGPFREKFVSMHALKRSGQPEEVAAAIAFLLSDEASFITAANIPVDGGFAGTHLVG